MENKSRYGSFDNLLENLDLLRQDLHDYCIENPTPMNELARQTKISHVTLKKFLQGSILHYAIACKVVRFLKKKKVE